MGARFSAVSIAAGESPLHAGDRPPEVNVANRGQVQASVASDGVVSQAMPCAEHPTEGEHRRGRSSPVGGAVFFEPMGVGKEGTAGAVGRCERNRPIAKGAVAIWLRTTSNSGGDGRCHLAGRVPLCNAGNLIWRPRMEAGHR
jgi:hypothetical protein